MIGRTVSHYDVVEKIGEGAMGEVYLAQDKKLRRMVALKFLPEHLTRDETRRARFVQEAMAAAAIEHPHIGAVYDIDEVDGHTFIAMEYVRGTNLRTAIIEHELPLHRAIELAIQIADALAKAHERGVIHRDLKPENVLLSEDGYIKVIDFGLAKLLEPLTKTEHATDQEADTWLKTEAGMIVGTAGYMSPEQARGENVDARSDVFSFGVLFYELVSGKSPFRRPSLVETLSAVLKDSPPPLSLEDADATITLNRILSQCLAKDTDGRYRNMRELSDDLRALRDQVGGRASAAVGTVVPRKQKWKWVAAVALAAVAGVAGLLLFGDRAPPPGIGATGRPALAVMHFQDHTGAEEVRWLSYGVPDMLMTGLAQTPGLDIVSGQRVSAILKEVGEDNVGAIDRSVTAELARRSGAGAIVVGSIYKSGDEIRIDVQVEDVSSGRLLGAESVRGVEVFALVDDLTKRIRAQLELQDRPAGRPIREVTTGSLEAYRLYQEGLAARYNLRHGDAQALFEEAVRLDPSFAKAHYQLWQTSATLGQQTKAEEFRQRLLANLDRLPPRDRVLVEARNTWEPGGNTDKAIELAQDLLERYPDHEEAYDLLVHIYSRESSNVDTILEHMERWSQAFPALGTSHHLNHFGYALLAKGRYTDAIRKFETYANAYPEEANPRDSLGEVYLVSGRPDRAIENYGRALEIDPGFGTAHVGRSLALGMLGRFDEALDEIRVAEDPAKTSGLPAWSISNLRAYLLSRVGRYQDAERQLDFALEAADDAGNAQGRVETNLMRAVMALERQDYRGAIEHAQQDRASIPKIAGKGYGAHSAMLTELLVGVAKARSGDIEGARINLEAQTESYDKAYSPHPFWNHALAGEIALASDDLERARAEFVASAPASKMWFQLGASSMSIFANNLLLRDGLARVHARESELDAAIEIYRELNTPDLSSKWVALFEPRYVLEEARLLREKGDSDAARLAYERFVELWAGADAELPELVEAHAYVTLR